MKKDKLIDRLISNVKSISPIVVGLDPQISRIPTEIFENNIRRFGDNKNAKLSTIFDFNKVVIDQIEGLCSIVKPQLAFYEIYGSAGLKVYEDSCAYARQKGLFIIADAKRGDIGSSSSAYAEAFLGGGGFSADFVTINPYLGSDCIDEFIKYVDASDKGVFILVKTSNPSSAQIQDLMTDEGSVYSTVANLTEGLSIKRIGKYGYSAVGAVVGATHSEKLAELRQLMPTSLFLVPGYGAQGGGGKSVSPAFDKDGLGAIVNSSRGIIYAGADGPDYKRCIHQAAKDMIADLAAAIK